MAEEVVGTSPEGRDGRSRSQSALADDERRLAELGYKQELHRRWSPFTNFAVSFAIICILSGCFTTYGQAFNDGGPIAISLGWPLISLLVICVALSMSELASAFPTAGGIYYWASKLGGAGWGWFTGWFNLIGLIAVTAGVNYGAAGFVVALLGLYKLNFIVNFGSTNTDYLVHVTFWMFIIITAADLLINLLRGAIVALVNRTSVWANAIGVLVIVALLIFVPDHHASLSYVFGTRQNNTGFSHSMYWFYILPLGFLLTMYTMTGYDASAHVSEETTGAATAAASGIWRSVMWSAIAGWIILLAITFAVQKSQIKTISTASFPAIAIFTTGMSMWAAKAVIIFSIVGQLFCGIACVTSASRMTFAFSRDGAVPGHNLWRRLSADRTPTWAALFACAFAGIITIPAYFPNRAGYPVAFFAVTSIATIGLYIAYTIPVFLRWRRGDAFETGPWNLGRHYRWVNFIAVVWVALCTVFFCLPTSPAGVYFGKTFSWSAVNYAPLVTIGTIAAVSIWYFGWARKWFKGPVRTIDDASVEAVADVAVEVV